MRSQAAQFTMAFQTIIKRQRIVSLLLQNEYLKTLQTLKMILKEDQVFLRVSLLLLWRKLKNSSIIYSNEEIDIEHKQCLKLITKPNLIEDDMLRILVSTHNRVLFEATKEWKLICDEKQQKLDRTLSINKILEEKLSKLSLHTKELQKKMSKSRYLKSTKVEFPVFNHEDEIILNNSKLEISEDQSSSAMLSVAQEISFKNNTHNEEDQSKLNESSKDNYSISNEEPKATNLKTIVWSMKSNSIKWKLI